MPLKLGLRVTWGVSSIAACFSCIEGAPAPFAPARNSAQVRGCLA